MKRATARRPAIATVMAALLAMGGCGEQLDVSTPGITREHRGDTAIVLTTGDGAWGPVHDAVEVLRVAETSKETTFGLIRAMAATPDGGVLVYDIKAAEGKIVRQFNAEGKFVRNVGRAGSGPGEYDMDVLMLAAAPNGTLVLREPFRGVSRYAPDGRFINRFTTDERSGAHEVVAAFDGSL